MVTNDVMVICGHDFDTAIEKIEADDSGWNGFLLQYHCEIPWFDKPWCVADIGDLIKCLQNGSLLANEPYFNKNNCDALIKFLNEGLSNSNAVVMEED